MARANHFTLYDLSDLVPARYWGSKEGTNLGGDLELDFMHSQAKGHKYLAEEIEKILKY